MKILSKISEPLTCEEIAGRLGFAQDEVRRVLHGMELAELVERQERASTRSVVALEHDADGGQILRGLLSAGARGYSGRVVRDQLGLQLLLKRSRPDAILIAQDTDELQGLAQQLRNGNNGNDVPWIAILPESSNGAGENFDAVLTRPYTQQQVVDALNAVNEGSASDGPENPMETTIEQAREELATVN